jgi:hypothetical protein
LARKSLNLKVEGVKKKGGDFMKNNASKKINEQEIWEEDIFDSYLDEMDKLVNKFPEDPNKEHLTEKKLHELIKELDDNWMAFQDKWKNRLQEADKVFASAKIKQDKNGMRHLVIKSEFSDDTLIDLAVQDKGF